MQLRYLIEVEVVSDDLAVEQLGQFDELHVHFADVRKILFHDLHVQMGHFLDALENIEAAAAAVALHRIGRVGHQLQLTQHKLGYDQDAVQESGFGDIGDASVDNHARVQNLVSLLRRFLAPENSAQGGQVEHVALLRAHDQTHIGHPQQQAHG